MVVKHRYRKVRLRINPTTQMPYLMYNVVDEGLLAREQARPAEKVNRYGSRWSLKSAAQAQQMLRWVMEMQNVQAVAVGSVCGRESSLCLFVSHADGASKTLPSRSGGAGDCRCSGIESVRNEQISVV